MSSVSELFQNLLDGLKKETSHYVRLFELGEEQKKILVAGDLERLPVNVRASEKEVFALGPLAASRTETLKQLGRQLGLGKPSLAMVAEKAPVEMKVEFQEVVAEVARSAKRLDDVNRGNEKLLENAVGYVNFTLNALKDGGETKPSIPSAALRLAGDVVPTASILNRVI